MTRARQAENAVRDAIEGGEEGHMQVAGASILAGIGIILIGIGAANDTGWLAVVGGILGGLGIVGTDLLRHTKIDYELFRRTDKLK